MNEDILMPANRRLTMRQLRQMVRLAGSGTSSREIAVVLSIARSTVQDNLRRAAAVGLTWPLPGELTDDALEHKLFSRNCVKQGTRRRTEPDWANGKDTGMVPMNEPETRFKLDMPGGVIEVRAECRDGKCLSITFRNAPAFAERLDANIQGEGVGTLKVDIAYGGMFYAIVDAKALGFSVVADEARDRNVRSTRSRMR
ncbi:proline racemase family protein [Mesorhizobium sp.]|uniref:proline racemase family protein n=1 Tax=Mesorhizobium sp. TaxID=1871066 RepID=UPI0025FF555C|nr:proline racemase family protein [Mesorhizobium sp.]